MSDEQQESQAIVEESVSASASTQSADSQSADSQSVDSQSADSIVDAMAILVIFTAAVAFCIFYISGWPFDL